MAGTSGTPAAKGVPLQTDAYLSAPGAGGTSPAHTGDSGPPVTSGTGLRLSGVAWKFGPVVAVSGVDLEVPLHSRLSIVGPSGCGKFALRALVCGLDEPKEDTIDDV